MSKEVWLDDAFDRTEDAKKKHARVHFGAHSSLFHTLADKPGKDIGNSLAAEFLDLLPEIRETALDVLPECWSEFAGIGCKERDDLGEFFDSTLITHQYLLALRPDAPHETFHDLLDEVFLAVEMLVESLLAHRKVGGNLVHRGFGEALFEKPFLACGEDFLFDDIFFRHFKFLIGNDFCIYRFRSVIKKAIWALGLVVGNDLRIRRFQYMN